VSYVAAAYRATDAAEWDDFVRSSRNGTFLLQRGFMDYHAERFQDHSLLLRDGNGRLAAVLPMNATGDALHSHAGLTYGGFVYGPRTGAADAMAMLEAAMAYMRAEGFTRLHYKTIPWIYHLQPAEDDRYALFRANASLVRRDVLAVVARDDRLRFQERRIRGAKAARRAGVSSCESTDYDAYWPILEETLSTRHGAAPVHSLEEMQRLAGRFPGSIRLFLATHQDSPAAGVVVFETPRVAHVQYIATTQRGREIGALDALLDMLLNVTYLHKAYFDFGISNEQQGRVLNVGLLEQKEGFGARAVVHDHYLLELGSGA
jgi:hypothetical protein